MAKHAGDEEYLAAAASEALGGEQVLAAGIFGWQDLVYAQAAGAAVGGTAGSHLASGAAGGAAGAGVGAAVGGYAAMKAMAEANGMTLQLLGAVTPTAIHVFNFDGDKAGDEVISFDRSTTDVHISRFGLSRIVHLRNTASGAEIKLHATAAPFSAQSKPDKIVLHLLAATD